MFAYCAVHTNGGRAEHVGMFLLQAATSEEGRESASNTHRSFALKYLWTLTCSRILTFSALSAKLYEEP